jgi:lipopolysaccharide/colanic/teichoic acid biosynthesis glycosyltransferase
MSRTLAGILLLVCAPLFLAFTVALWTTQQSSVFERVWLPVIGRELWQFRTEYRSVTGRWMRRWSIDPWPALWNAFWGQIDMFHLVDAYRDRRR